MSVLCQYSGKIWRYVISILISYECRNMEKVFIVVCKSCIYMQVSCKTVQIFFGDMQSVVTNDCIHIVHVFAVQVGRYMHNTLISCYTRGKCQEVE